MTGSGDCDSITLVTPGFSPSIGGVEAHTTALASRLLERGLSIEVLTARRGLRSKTDEYRDGIRVVTYPAWGVQSMSVSPRLAMAAIGSRHRDRIMHVHGYHATTAFALAGRSAPTVFTPHYHGRHGHSRLANILHLGYYWVARHLIRRCDGVICVSESERDCLTTDFSFLNDRVAVLPNGVAASEIARAATFADEPATVVVVGRLEEYKRVDAIVRAFVQVPAPTQLVVVGHGTQAEQLQRLAVDLGIDGRIRFVGAVPDADVHRWLATARVLVSMSRREAFGMAPLEAAAAGCAAVLSDIPAHREIVTKFLGDCAVLHADPSPPALAGAIVAALDSPPKAPKNIPDWTRVAAATAAVYDEACEHRNNRRHRQLTNRRRSDSRATSRIGTETEQTR